MARQNYLKVQTYKLTLFKNCHVFKFKIMNYEFILTFGDLNSCIKTTWEGFVKSLFGNFSGEHFLTRTY